jgi:hypothetical protein
MIQLSNTNYVYKIVQRFEVIFYQDDSKNRCIAMSTELFFEEVLMKKNENIGLIYKNNWYVL